MKRLCFFLSFCLLMVMSGCKEFKEIQVVGVDGFSIKKLSTQGIEAEVRLKIKNPNATGFSIYPSEFDVMYSGIRLGKARLHKRVHIAGNAEKVYAFELKSTLSDFNILDATKLLNLDANGSIELSGDLKAGKFYLKKRYPVNFKERINSLK